MNSNCTRDPHSVFCISCTHLFLFLASPLRDMHLSKQCCLSSLLHPHCCDLPKTPALHCGDPITLNRLQTDTKNTASWANASLSSALITGRGLEENCFSVMTILWAATQQFSFLGPTSLIYPTCCCASFKAGIVCVGCTGENKGFAGIRRLQQTNGSKKLAVAPSDTWSAFNLTEAKWGTGVGGGWRGHCFCAIIFKSLG